eukprot:4335030-Karenia_brevis.AAC.1
MDRPWVVPSGHDIQWGHHTLNNQGPGGHKLQWYRGVLYCGECGGWTLTQGNPSLLRGVCKGKRE